MDAINLQEIWKQHEVELEVNRALNMALLKEVRKDKAKSSIKSLLFVPISTLIFFTLSISYCLYFTVTNWEPWYFALSGILLMVFSFLFIPSSVRQLKLILSIDYDAPVIQLQKNLSLIKSSIVDNLRIAAWILPFYPIMIIFFSKVLFNLDFVAILRVKMILIYGLISLLFAIVAIIVSKVLSPKNSNKKWLNWLLRGSGSQVDEALSFLNQMEEFVMEEQNRKERTSLR